MPNDLMETKEASIRKQQNILVCSGVAMILFGLWSILRLTLMRFVDPEHFVNFFSTPDMPSTPEFMNFILVVALVLLLFDLILRVYIGSSAIKDGLGMLRTKITYIIVAIICLVFAIVSDVTSIISLFYNDFSFEFFLASIIDMSIHIATLEIVIAAIKIRKLTKEK